jgi:hypothetical protein
MIARSVKRLDANRVRLAAVGLGLGLGVLWVVGLGTGATNWLSWFMALAGLACWGTVALVPERRAGIVAAGNLAFVAAGLVALWIVALATSSTPWLVWCCFGAAGLVLLAAVATALAAVFDLVG